MQLIYNGQLINETNLNVGFDNRAFTYGDGIFETLIVTNGKTRLLPNHLDRLYSGINAIGMNVPPGLDLKSVESMISSLTECKNITGQARVKIMVWRKTGGLFNATEKEGEFVITANVHTAPQPVKSNAILYKDVRTIYSPISRYKTLSCLPYIMAGITKNNSGVDDVILFDSDNHVSECLVSNIFWISGDQVHTPSILTGCKEGIMRKQILQLLTKEKIWWEEGRFKESVLMEADFVFTSNVAGITPILRISNKTFQNNSEIFNTILSKINIGE